MKETVSFIAYIVPQDHGNIAIQPVTAGTFALILFQILYLAFMLQPCMAMEEGGMPATVSRLLYKVSRLYEHGKYKKAVDLIRRFRSGSEKFTRNPDVLYAQGTCCLALKDYHCAAKSFRNALAARPNHVPSWQNLANAQYGMGDYKGASRSFERAFDAGGEKDPALLYYSGVCLLLADRPANAVRLLERAFAEFPAMVNLEWKEALVRALLASHHNRKALPLLEQLVSHCSGDKKEQWSQVLLYQYLHMNMRNRARSFALNLARLHPEEGKWWKAVARCALEIGDLEEAVTAMTIVSFLRPLNPDETRLLADMNLRAGIPQTALECYKRLLTKKPSSVILKYAVYASQMLGRGDEGLRLLESYRKLADSNPDLMIVRGDILYSKARYQDAMESYLEATRQCHEMQKQRRRHGKCREEGRAWFMAGCCALHVKDWTAAKMALDMAATFPAQKKKARQAVRDLKAYTENSCRGNLCNDAS